MRNQLLALELKQECELCDKLFFSDSDLSNHLKEKHSNVEPTEYHCKCCKLTFNSFDIYNVHLDGHYKNAAVLTNPPQNERHANKKPKLEENNDAAARGVKRKKNNQKRKASVLSKVQKNKKSIVHNVKPAELKTRTRAAVKNKISENKNKTIVESTDANKRVLRTRNSTNDKFTCDICNKAFIKRYLLAQHKRTH